MAEQKDSNQENCKNILVSKNDLKNIKMNIHQVAGHTFASYGSFYAGNMSMAKEFSDKSKTSFIELIARIDVILKEQPKNPN